MKAYLLTWNPQKYSWEDMDNDIKLLNENQYLKFNWTCNSKKPKFGDIFFIKATGNINGIFCSGTIDYLKESVHSDFNRSGLSNMVYGEIKALLNPLKEDILKSDILKEKFPNQNWAPQQSGIKINDDIVDELKIIWESFNKSKTNYKIEYVNKEFWEGNIQRKLYTTYERNSSARDECINHYGYICQICGINMEELYGNVGKHFIHVHHKNFLSNFGEDHKVDPINDLTTLCPNCHAMLHRKIDNEYYTVEKLRNEIKMKNK